MLQELVRSCTSHEMHETSLVRGNWPQARITQQRCRAHRPTTWAMFIYCAYIAGLRFVVSLPPADTINTRLRTGGNFHPWTNIPVNRVVQRRDRRRLDVAQRLCCVVCLVSAVSCWTAEIPVPRKHQIVMFSFDSSYGKSNRFPCSTLQHCLLFYLVIHRLLIIVKCKIGCWLFR